MDLLTAALLALAVWALARLILELIKQSWERATLVKQMARAGSLAAAEKLVQVSFVCAVSWLALRVGAAGLAALGSFTPDNVYPWVSSLDMVKALVSGIGHGMTGLILGLVVVLMIVYAWREGPRAVADRVREHVAGEYARLSRERDAKGPGWKDLPPNAEMQGIIREYQALQRVYPPSPATVAAMTAARERYVRLDVERRIDEPLSVEIGLPARQAQSRCARVWSFVFSQGLVSSAKGVRKLSSRLGLIALCLSAIWVNAEPLGRLVDGTINQLIVNWEQKRTRDELRAAASARTPEEARAATPEDIEAADLIVQEVMAILSRDPAFHLTQPAQPAVESLKRKLRTHVARATILQRHYAADGDPIASVRTSLTREEEVSLLAVAIPDPPAKGKGKWVLAIPGAKTLLPSIHEKLRAYKASFSQPISLGTLHDAVLDQVANYVWNAAPLETQSSAGSLAKKIVDEFGEYFLKQYFKAKLQRAIVALATSTGPYDPSALVNELRPDQRLVSNVSRDYVQQVEAMTRELGDAAKTAENIEQHLGVATEQESSSGVEAKSSARPPDGLHGHTGFAESPPAEAFIIYDDLPQGEEQAKKNESERRDEWLGPKAPLWPRPWEPRISPIDPRHPPGSWNRKEPSRPKPSRGPRRKAIEVVDDVNGIPWPLTGFEVNLRWVRSGMSLTLYAGGGRQAPEELLGTFDARVVHQALRFAADGRRLAVTVRSVTWHNQELQRILLHPSLEDSPLGCALIRADLAIADAARDRLGVGSAVDKYFTYLGLREQPALPTVVDPGVTTDELPRFFRFVVSQEKDRSSQRFTSETLDALGVAVFAQVSRAVPHEEFQLIAQFMLLQRFFRGALYGPMGDRIAIRQLALLARDTQAADRIARTPGWDLRLIRENDVPGWMFSQDSCRLEPAKAEQDTSLD